MRFLFDLDLLPILATVPDVLTSEVVPELEPVAVDDYEDRLAAMTAHHLDLSLLDLTTPEPVFWMFDGKLLCHPNNAARLRAAVEAIRG